MVEPTTKAGKRLLDPARPWLLAQPNEVAAIEAEAVAAYRARLAAGVGELRGYQVGKGLHRDPTWVDTLTVLRLIEETP
jgi:hypothetical protein